MPGPVKSGHFCFKPVFQKTGPKRRYMEGIFRYSPGCAAVGELCRQAQEKTTQPPLLVFSPTIQLHGPWRLLVRARRKGRRAWLFLCQAVVKDKKQKAGTFSGAPAFCFTEQGKG
ncbi:hypothetical protein TH63_03375 [Rufibacter radiotolerans]|uniref:Uncharacterized protein n=1 Tax=Rufibacter radiotolerans TaxID=1379910 RepID=A0A0H4VGX9_9BACT|nr:hypothetical protein TH63_03375 [Rufibacter radiotolerans]